MHNSKTIFKVILFIGICLGINWMFSFLLIPSSYVRLSLNNINSNDNKYDHIFIGTSHGQYGIDPKVVDSVTGKKSTNLCMADQYPIDTYYLLKEALRNQKPEKIIYEVDPSYWITEQRVGSPKVFIFKEMQLSLNKLAYCDAKLLSKNFRTTLFPWIYYRNLYSDAGKNVSTKFSQAYKEFHPSSVELPLSSYEEEGFIYRNEIPNELKGTFNNIPWDETQVKKEALSYFKKIVNLCKENNIELELIVTPVPKETIANMPDNYASADKYFEGLAKKYNVGYHNFNFIDESELERGMGGYWDYDGHMYGEFARKFSEKLGRFLKTKI